MNSKLNYGKFDKLLHWLIAINISLTLIFSYGMSDLPGAEKVIEYGDHGMSVTSIFLFMVIRLVWRMYTGFPPLPVSMSDVQKLAAKAVHYLLYVCIFLQIGIGVLLASTTEQEFIATGYNINYTSFDLIAKSNYELLLLLHKTGYWVIIALLFMHIAAALKHHFIDKDDVLRRMLPFVKQK